MSEFSENYEEMLNSIKKSGKLKGFREIMKAESDFKDPRDHASGARELKQNVKDYQALAEGEAKNKGKTNAQMITGSGAEANKKRQEASMENAWDKPTAKLTGQQAQVFNNASNADNTAIADMGSRPKHKGMPYNDAEDMSHSPTYRNGSKTSTKGGQPQKVITEDGTPPEGTETKNPEIYNVKVNVTDDDRLESSNKDPTLESSLATEGTGTEHKYDDMGQVKGEETASIIYDKNGNILGHFVKPIIASGEEVAVNAALKQQAKDKAKKEDDLTAKRQKRGFNADVKDYVEAYRNELLGDQDELTPEQQSLVSDFESKVNRYFKNKHNIDDEGTYQKPKEIVSVQDMDAALDGVQERFEALEAKGKLPAELANFQDRIDEIWKNTGDTAGVSAYMGKYDALVSELESVESATRSKKDRKVAEKADAETAEVEEILNRLAPSVQQTRDEKKAATRDKAAATRLANAEAAAKVAEEQETLRKQIEAENAARGPAPDPEESFREGREFALPRAGEHIEYTPRGDPNKGVGPLYQRHVHSKSLGQRVLANGEKISDDDISIYQKLSDAFRRTPGKLAEVQQMATNGEFKAWANPALRNRPGYYGRLMWMIDQGYNPIDDTYHFPKDKQNKFKVGEHSSIEDAFLKNTESYEDSNARIQSKTAEGRAANDPDALYDSSMSILSAESQDPKKIRIAVQQLKDAARSTKGSSGKTKACLELARIYLEGIPGSDLIILNKDLATKYLDAAVGSKDPQVSSEAVELGNKHGINTFEAQQSRTTLPSASSRDSLMKQQQRNLDRAKEALNRSTGRLDEYGKEIHTADMGRFERFIRQAIIGVDDTIRQEAIKLAEDNGIDTTAMQEEAAKQDHFSNEDAEHAAAMGQLEEFDAQGRARSAYNPDEDTSPFGRKFREMWTNILGDIATSNGAIKMPANEDQLHKMEIASKRGDIRATAAIANAYANGYIDIEADPDKAISYAKRLVELDHPKSDEISAMIEEYEQNKDAEAKAAADEAKWKQLRAEHDGTPIDAETVNDPESGLESVNQPDWTFEGDGKEVPFRLRPYWEKDLDTLRELCEKGDANAQYVFCRKQTGRVPKNPEEFRWYLNAAKQGSVDALVAAALAAGSPYSHPSTKSLEAETNSGKPLGFNKRAGGKKNIFEILSLATELGGEIGEWARRRIMDLDIVARKTKDGEKAVATRPENPLDGKWYKMWAENHPGEIGALHPILETRQLDEVLARINAGYRERGFDTSNVDSNNARTMYAEPRSMDNIDDKDLLKMFKKGDLDAGYNLALRGVADGHQRRAKNIFNKIIESGNPIGYIGLARLYLTSTGFKNDVKIANEYLDKAEEAGADPRSIAVVRQLADTRAENPDLPMTLDELNKVKVNSSEMYGSESEARQRQIRIKNMFDSLKNSPDGEKEIIDYIDNVGSFDEIKDLAKYMIEQKEPLGFHTYANLYLRSLLGARHNLEKISNAMNNKGHVSIRSYDPDKDDKVVYHDSDLEKQYKKNEENVKKYMNISYQYILKYALTRGGSSKKDLDYLLRSVSSLDQIDQSSKYTEKAKKDFELYTVDPETMKLVKKPTKPITENPILASKDVNPMTSFKDMIQKAMDEKQENRGYPLTSEPIIKDEKGYPSLLHAHVDSTLPIADTYRVVAMGQDKDMIDMRPRQADCKKK